MCKCSPEKNGCESQILLCSLLSDTGKIYAYTIAIKAASISFSMTWDSTIYWQSYSTPH